LTSLDGSVNLWIDQISINQENDDEKIQQIQLMSHIFSQAWIVIGWLGVPGIHDHFAFDLFRILGSSRNLSAPQSLSNNRSGEGSALSQAIRDLTDVGLIEGFADLFDPNTVISHAAAASCQRPWFRRLWIVQEAALAQELELGWGELIIPSR
jgi:hypothetical protein